MSIFSLDLAKEILRSKPAINYLETINWTTLKQAIYELGEESFSNSQLKMFEKKKQNGGIKEMGNKPDYKIVSKEGDFWEEHGAGWSKDGNKISLSLKTLNGRVSLLLVPYEDKKKKAEQGDLSAPSQLSGGFE